MEQFESIPPIPLPALSGGRTTPVVLPHDASSDIAQILRVLTELIDQYKTDAFVRHCAVIIGSPVWPDDPMIRDNIEAWVRRRMIYVRDPDGEEFIVTPDRTLLETSGMQVMPQTNAEWAALDESLRSGSVRAPGDCDDFVVLLGTLLAAVGFQVRPAGAAVNGAGYHNHVVLQVLDERRNVWRVIDATTPFAHDYGTLMIVTP